MPSDPSVPLFSAELRRLRLAAGLSTRELADLIHFSKGYVSKVETGLKSPSTHFIRMSDTALRAEGRLIALTTAPATPAGQPSPDDRGPDVIDEAMGSLPDNPRRNPLEVPTLRVDSPSNTDSGPDDAGYTLKSFRAMFTSMRDLGQTLNPAIVVEMLKPQTVAIQELALRLNPSRSQEAMLLAAHIADYTGWMTQEMGDDVTALRWIDLTAELAERAGDGDMVAYSCVRRANIALYQQDAFGTISFARHAQAMDCSPKIRGLAAQREAQGHALAGDYDAFKRCIDLSTELHSSAEPSQADRPVAGPTKIPDPVALSEGWALYDLGRSERAIEVLEPLLRNTPKARSRAWARIGARLALALASVREVDRACALTREILILSPIIESATIRADLRQLSRMLNRWNFDPAVQQIMPSLSAALLPTASRRHAPIQAPGS